MDCVRVCVCMYLCQGLLEDEETFAAGVGVEEKGEESDRLGGGMGGCVCVCLSVCLATRMREQAFKKGPSYVLEEGVGLVFLPFCGCR